MSVIPDGKLAKVDFSEAHIAPFTANAVAIGTTSAAVTDLATKTTAARAAYANQQAAHNAARAATNDFNIAVRAMTTALSDIIKQVRAKAATAGDGVYSLAELPVPAAPGPLGPLAKPTDFKVALSEGGALELSWKCTQPKGAGGTFYQVWRRVGGEGAPFAYVGGTGTKHYVDATLPAGSASVTYQVQAVRSTSTGPVAQFTVNFGVATPGGAITAMVVETTPAKIAA